MRLELVEERNPFVPVRDDRVAEIEGYPDLLRIEVFHDLVKLGQIAAGSPTVFAFRGGMVLEQGTDTQLAV